VLSFFASAIVSENPTLYLLEYPIFLKLNSDNNEPTMVSSLIISFVDNVFVVTVPFLILSYIFSDPALFSIHVAFCVVVNLLTSSTV
jgi:hypothetical protein